MTTMTIIQKWKNLSLLIVSKTEHKRKFNKHIGMGDGINGIVITLKIEIEYKLIRHKVFRGDLIHLIWRKINEYKDHRKTMILVDYDDTTEYNPENDCPICFETYSPILQNEKGKVTGDSCEHSLCWRCYITIISDNNKCPICRVKLDSNINGDRLVNEDDLEDETDEEEDEVFNGINNEPTTQLFIGQRWLNIDTDELEYWNGECWTNHYSQSRLTMANFMSRHYIRAVGQCNYCGIQRTQEVNTFIMDRHNNNLIVDGEDWDNAFEDGFDECFECRQRCSQMSDIYYGYYDNLR